MTRPKPTQERSQEETVVQLRESLALAHSEFDIYRGRVQAENEKMRLKGRDDATVALLGIIDDFDRALSHIGAADSDLVTSGVTQLLARALRHFAELGYQPFGEVGERFNPQVHEAISVEPGTGPDGSILRVHRRGWTRDGEVVRPTTVTVLQGVELLIAEEPSAERRRRRRPEQEDYVCPYGIAGCQQDCPGCTPAPPVFGEPGGAFVGDGFGEPASSFAEPEGAFGDGEDEF